MVYGIESFGCIEEKEEPLYSILDTFIKKIINIKNVVTTLPVGEETFLSGVNKVQHRRKAGLRHSRC